MTTISWSVPTLVKGNLSWDKIKVYRGTDENDIASYLEIATIDREDTDGNDVVSYSDSTTGNGRNLFYIIRYYNSSSTALTKYFLTFFELTPRESRYVNSLRQMLDPIITSTILADGTFQEMTDEELILALSLALSWFNMYSPVTSFTLSSFPSYTAENANTSYDTCLLYLAQICFIMNKYMSLGFRDFTYNENGISLGQSFAPAMQAAFNQTRQIIDPLMSMAKLEFSDQAITGVGSVPMSISMGGGASKSMMNVLNIFSAMGR